MEWNPVNDRIIGARFSRFAKLTIIQIYSRPNKTDKDAVNKQLQREMTKVLKHDILIAMYDANAKVGKSNDECERVMGQEGIGTMNENCLRLAEMCPKIP
jgi:hypothetical protein